MNIERNIEKLEVANYLIGMLIKNSKKYIRVQSKAHLEMVRDQLMECHKKIMGTKITSLGKCAIIEIDYLDNYKG